ncbi:TetR/AcrR family transcriptional regulator [Mycolicibacterium holsaticum]|uniref:TetR/AcrR family transcriptional regulator n=1 Tax=Mycolicibacterium holsaticum TaxID=152142 RepID=UPI0009FBCFC8|nr:TetR/AcrR family transcriptional regulator [Mycolicibacterium holsaticum]
MPHPPLTDDTPVLLLDAAEKLIASEGVDGLSVRAVNALAGRNPAAVRYHFRDKEGLISAVLRRRLERVDEELKCTVAEIRARPGHLRFTAHDLAEAIIRPVATVRQREPWGRTYLQFLASLMGSRSGWRQLTQELFRPQWEFLRSLFAEALPDLRPQSAEFRLRVLGRGAVATLADLEDVVDFFSDEFANPEEAAIDDLIDCLAVGLSCQGSQGAGSRPATY